MEPEPEESLKELVYDAGFGDRDLPNFTLISENDTFSINKRRVAFYGMLREWDFEEARDDFVKAYKEIEPSDENGIEDMELSKPEHFLNEKVIKKYTSHGSDFKVLNKVLRASSAAQHLYLVRLMFK